MDIWHRRCGGRDERFRLGWQPSFKYFVYFLKTVILLAFSLLRLPQLWLSSHPESGLLMLFACSAERLMERVNMNVRYELFWWAKWILETDNHRFALVFAHYFSLKQWWLLPVNKTSLSFLLFILNSSNYSISLKSWCSLSRFHFYRKCRSHIIL